MIQKKIETLFLSIVCAFFILTLITACGSSRKVNTDYTYFGKGADTVMAQLKETVIQPNDKLSIQVYSKMQNQEQAAIFNIPQSPGNAVQSYEVSPDGNIELPVIGSVKAAGLNKDQLQAAIEQKLPAFVKSPSVIVRFLQFSVNVLGEVHAPGIHKFDVDRVTIIDAIGAAGDLTDYGKREDVTVIREANGRRIYYTVDLRNRALFESDVYVLQPNDIVYVSPNKYKLKNLSVDPDAQRRLGLLFSITSLILGVASFLITTLR